jgi:hypothetical protein
MPKVVFEADTHQQIVTQVRRWLASADADTEEHLSPTQAVEQGAELTKDALRVIASAAPRPIAEREVVRLLTGMGYRATDLTKDCLLSSLDQLDHLTGGRLVRTVSEKGRSAVYEMNVVIARQLLKQVHGV